MAGGEMTVQYFSHESHRRVVLPENAQPDGFAFLSSSGGLDRRFVGSGCYLLTDPEELSTKIKELRKRTSWSGEIGFSKVTKGSMHFYRSAIDLLARSEGAYSCIVADREHCDPFLQYGSPGHAEEEFFGQLLSHMLGSHEQLAVDSHWGSISCVGACATINHRLRRPALGHMTPRHFIGDAEELLALVTVAVLFEFLRSAGLASSTNSKAALVEHLRDAFGVPSLPDGGGGRLSVGIFKDRHQRPLKHL
jgi:hypothetical protein